MKFEKYLNETVYFKQIPWKNYKTKEWESTKLYINPTAKDIKEMDSDWCEFIIDTQTKKIYAWNNKEVNWSDVVEEFPSLFPGFDYKETRYLYGQAKFVNGKLSYKPIKHQKDLLVKNSSWLKDYFTFGLTEEYAFLSSTYPGWRDKAYEVFVNPSMKELKTAEANNKVRFCIDMEQKKIYVWNPFLLHYDMSKDAEKEGILDKESYTYKDAIRSPYVFGVAEVVGGKLEILEQGSTEGSNINFDTVDRKAEKFGSLTWAKHWFTALSYKDLTGQ